jgi:hypothetical protein
MATGSYIQATKAPNAARYLCDKSKVYDIDVGLVPKNRVCLHDFSSGGLCSLEQSYFNPHKKIPDEPMDGFSRGMPVRSLARNVPQPRSSTRFDCCQCEEPCAWLVHASE